MPVLHIIYYLYCVTPDLSYEERGCLGKSANIANGMETTTKPGELNGGDEITNEPRHQIRYFLTTRVFIIAGAFQIISCAGLDESDVR